MRVVPYVHLTFGNFLFFYIFAKVYFFKVCNKFYNVYICKVLFFTLFIVMFLLSLR